MKTACFQEFGSGGLIDESGGSEIPGQGGDQVRSVDGFADIVIATGGEAFFAVADDGAGRDGDDRDCDPLFTEKTGGVETVEPRHLHVEDNQVEGRFHDFFDGGLPVADEGDGQSQLLQEGSNEGLIGADVLGDEDLALEPLWQGFG